MLIIKLKGGLGNQLFQYGFGRLLAEQRNEQLKLDISALGKGKDTKRNFDLTKFNIQADLATLDDLEKYTPSPYIRFIKQKIFRQFNIGYVPSLLSSKKHYFEGYFQSYKYLDPIRDKLVTEITLKKPLDNYYQNISNQIIANQSVAIHIRRGDFANNQKIRSIHQTIDINYYQQALDLIKNKLSNPVYFVFSDDIAWAQKNLITNKPTIYVAAEKNSDPAQELILMSQCQHQIIANSTFSWWAAYINQNQNKIVISPKKWNNKYQKHYRDLLPKNWQIIQ